MLPAAEQAQLDANPTLFVLGAAMQAAGYDAPAAGAPAQALRQAVAARLAGKNLPSVPELQRFFRDHARKTSEGKRAAGADYSQYVSFALSVEGPPAFGSRFQESDTPPDVIALLGLNELLARFYKEAELEGVWTQAQPAVDRLLQPYQQPVSGALLEANGYLRNPTVGYLGRRFLVYLDVWGANEQVQARQYASDYFVVITPAAAAVNAALAGQGTPVPPAVTQEVRHQYFHYLFDPLAAKYAEQVQKRQSLIDYALGAPLLPEAYKSDFLLLVTESLIKAVEARLGPPARRPDLTAQALTEGYILTPFFSEQLPLYEKQEQSMRLYYPGLIQAIDVKKEAKRLDPVKFASERAARPVSASATASAPAPPAQPLLEQAEELYARRAADAANGERAAELYLRVLRDTDDHTLQSRAYYGLARLALVKNEAESARNLFQKALAMNPDGQTKAWAHVYLGRMADLAGEREQALAQYQAALAVPEITPNARQIAETGRQRPFAKQQP